MLTSVSKAVSSFMNRWEIGFGGKRLVGNCCGNFFGEKFVWKMFGGQFWRECHI